MCRYFTLPFIITIFSLCSTAMGEKGLYCEDEIRILSHDGNVIQGKLLNNDGHEVKLLSNVVGGDTILATTMFDDIAKVYRIKRFGPNWAFGGLILGAGAGVGAVYILTKGDCTDNGNYGGCVDSRINTAMGIGIVGGLVGCLVGYQIGQRMQELIEFQPGELPVCSNMSVRIMPIRIVFNFSL